MRGCGIGLVVCKEKRDLDKIIKLESRARWAIDRSSTIGGLMMRNNVKSKSIDLKLNERQAQDSRARVNWFIADL